MIIMDWIQSNWYVIAGLLITIVGGLYVPFLRGILVKAFQALLTEAVLKKVFLMLAESLVKSTKNTLDDLWLEELKKKMNA